MNASIDKTTSSISEKEAARPAAVDDARLSAQLADDLVYLRKEEEQLRKKEELLRKKEEQLRDEKKLIDSQLLTPSPLGPPEIVGPRLLAGVCLNLSPLAYDWIAGFQPPFGVPARDDARYALLPRSSAPLRLIGHRGPLAALP